MSMSNLSLILNFEKHLLFKKRNAHVNKIVLHKYNEKKFNPFLWFQLNVVALVCWQAIPLTGYKGKFKFD